MRSPAGHPQLACTSAAANSGHTGMIICCICFSYHSWAPTRLWLLLGAYMALDFTGSCHSNHDGNMLEQDALRPARGFIDPLIICAVWHLLGANQLVVVVGASVQWLGHSPEARICSTVLTGCCAHFCRNDFTIHGLWPDYNDGSYPSFCTKTKFNPSKVDDLLPELKAEWPTYAAKGGDAFWKHEYEKHGTCSTATFPDEHQYFAGVLDLNQQYNLLVSPSC